MNDYERDLAARLTALIPAYDVRIRKQRPGASDDYVWRAVATAINHDNAAPLMRVVDSRFVLNIVTKHYGVDLR